MRKPLVILTLVFCLLVQLSSVSLAATWRQCAWNNATDWYFDTESVHYITPNGEEFIEVWVKIVVKNPQSSDSVKTIQTKYWYKLDRKAYAERVIYRYDGNGNTISTVNQRGSWIDCIPGSVGEKAYDTVKAYCEENL